MVRLAFNASALLSRVAAKYDDPGTKAVAERLFGGECSDEELQDRVAELWRENQAVHLTAREMEVIACIARGCSNRDIAESLYVSEKTVKNHLTSIFRKLHVNDRTQALIYVLKHKLMTLDGPVSRIS